MRRKKDKMKKRIALIAATVLAAGASMPLVNYVAELRAAASQPDIHYYADAEQLINLKMGASEHTRVQLGMQSGGKGFAEWYIVGEDTGIAGSENVILFSAQSLGKTAYQGAAGTGTEEIDHQVTHGEYPPREGQDGGPPAYPGLPNEAKYDKVFANHYGASTLRNQLNTLANGNLFSSVKGLMLPTKLHLTDARNKDLDGNYDTYTVDTLFYPPARDDGTTSLWFGSNYDVSLDDGISAQVEIESMWAGIKQPQNQADNKNLAYVYGASGGAADIQKQAVNTEQAVYPAFALDLSKVLFGSVAEKAGGTGNTVKKIDTSADTPLLLRLDGSEKYSTADVAYNTSEISHKNAPAGSRIIVQGKGLPGETSQDAVEWYWVSNPVSGTGKIGTSELTTAVVTQLGATTDQNINLGACKIWLETSETLGGLPYAIKGHEGIVDKIVLSGVEKPAGDTKLSLSAKVDEEITKGIRESEPAIVWTDANNTVTSTGAYGQKYTASIEVNLADGYSWLADKNTLRNNTVIKLTNGDEIACTDIRDTDGKPNIKTLIFEYTIAPNPEIEYKVLFDGAEVEDPTQGIKTVYDGKQHTIEIRTETAGALYPQCSFNEAGAGDFPNPNDWTTAPLNVEDAGEYTVYFQIRAADDTHHAVDATTNTSEVKPISVTIEPKMIWISPESQEIPWTKDLKINERLYTMTSGNGNPAAKPLVSEDHVITGLKLTPEMGAIINKDGIISEGWIFFYPTTTDENGDKVLSYAIYDQKTQKDVSKNYDVQQDAPGKLRVLHNENLPPDSITVEKAKTTYKLGEALMVNDLKVTARYGDGYTEAVPKGGGHDSLTTNEEDIDMTTLGGKTLTVTYTREEPDEAKGSASATLTVNVVEEEEPGNSQNPGGNDGNNGNNGNNNNPGGTNNPTNNGTSTNTGTTRAASNQGGTGTNSGTGTTSGTNKTNSKTTTASGARTGDTSPIVGWVLAALSSGIVVVSLMIFNMNRSIKKRKVKNKK